MLLKVCFLRSNETYVVWTFISQSAMPDFYSKVTSKKVTFLGDDSLHAPFMSQYTP